MSEQSRIILKSYLETGDTPSEAQFIDLVDSSPNINDDLPNFGTPLSIKVSVPSASILTLNSAPFDIIPAPGVGIAIFPIFAAARMIFNTAAYAAFTQPELFIENSALRSFPFPAAWLANVANSFIMLARQAGGADIEQLVANESLQLREPAGEPTLGDSIVNIYVKYHLVTV